MNDLFLLAVNLTSRCNLACDHCYMDADTLLHGAKDELQTDEVKGLLDEIAGRSNETMVVLTGGEPLLRPDLTELVAHGTRLGLSMVVGSNGVLLDEQRILALKEAGAMGLGISLDSLDPAFHDKFRGRPGTWEKTLSGMDACRRHGLPFQVHFSVTEANAHETQAMIDFARSVGAHVLNIFFLICTGRGESMSDITPKSYEQVLNLLVEAQDKYDDIIIRARCAPHFKRVAYEHNPASPLTRAEGYEGGGCLAGIHYCRITPNGEVTACPYIPTAEGNIREQGFWPIWDSTPTFQGLRAPQLTGKCGRCEFRILCGGCRARPYALGGDLMDEDGWCSYEPKDGELIEPLKPESDDKVTWSPEAEKRLSRVPGFLRKMVRKRAEEHVSGLGENVVTTDHMAALAKHRFGDNMPTRPGAPVKPEKTQEETPQGLAWTAEARKHLEALPSFLRDGVQQVAEDVARSEGRLEVNIKLLERLESNETEGRSMGWSQEAEQQLEQALSEKAPPARLFIQPSLEASCERIAREDGATTVSNEHVKRATTTLTAGVEWDEDALNRVKSAPDFIRGGIKKAAEANARREGLARITSDDLTRFRNRAMMCAVRRMKGFGMSELDFGAFEIAKERVPRLKDNEQAAKRFSTIKEYVESRTGEDGEGLGLLDRELMEKMKRELSRNS